MASDPPLLDSGNIAGPYKKGIRLVGCPFCALKVFQKGMKRSADRNPAVSALNVPLRDTLRAR